MTAFVRLVVCACVLWSAQAQYAEERAPRYIASEPKAPATTPVPILKQINRHNEDGSYTYGYEAADGSFKIETKSPIGEVKGKYGYKDDTGKLRVVEYGANKFGFQPAGEGITVAPPTLVDESAKENQRQNKGQGNSNQYRQQQQPDYDYDEPAPTPAPRPVPRPQPQQQYRAPQQQQQQYRPAPQQQQQQQYRPAPQQQPQQQYRPAPQQQQQPQYRAPQQQQQQQQQQYRPAPQSAPTPPRPQFFSGAAPAPAQDFFNPEPAPRQYKPKQQDFRPAPQSQDYNNFGPAPSPEPRFAPPSFQQPRNTQTFSMLDQLLKEYSLPSGGSPALHDITFGSF